MQVRAPSTSGVGRRLLAPWPSSLVPSPLAPRPSPLPPHSNNPAILESPPPGDLGYNGWTMGEGLVKYLSSKVIGIVLLVCGTIIVIWYLRLTDEQRATMWSVARGTLIWAGCVAALPWALFFVPAWVMRLESNLASAAMLAGFLLVDIALALILSGPVPHTWQKAALLFGFLCAAAYNFVVCEFLARRSEEQ